MTEESGQSNELLKLAFTASGTFLGLVGIFVLADVFLQIPLAGPLGHMWSAAAITVILLVIYVWSGWMLLVNFENSDEYDDGPPYYAA